MDFNKHAEGTTSVKVHHAPGGKSNFSLGWDNAEPAPKKQNNPPPQQQQQPVANQPQNIAGFAQPKQNTTEDVKTSVKVHNPPGGKSNFTLG